VDIVNVIPLVAGRVEMNPGPPVEQMKMDQIWVYNKNLEKEGKAINRCERLLNKKCPK
jgi:hypothetical protein